MTRIKTTRIDWRSVKERLDATQQALTQSSTIDETRMRDVLRRRAEQLAAPGGLDAAGVQTPVLTFRLGSERYGLELRHVAQVVSEEAITPVPGAPRTLAGIANLLGEVRSVLDLRPLLGLPELDGNAKRSILLLRRGIGLRVEQLDGIRPVALQELNREQSGTDNSAGCIDGFTPDNLIVLNVEALCERGRT